mmetsp:Transcript_2778/g.7188  ORF Transcript_2778/g.7188 Transcript_2778/m.7188 type:complete len:85 (+) Transcript_2778:890-1144(+)
MRRHAAAKGQVLGPPHRPGVPFTLLHLHHDIDGVQHQAQHVGRCPAHSDHRSPRSPRRSPVVTIAALATLLPRRHAGGSEGLLS